MKVRKVLTPCPPKKRCAICEARLNEVFGSADKTKRYVHQAAEAGHKARLMIYADESKLIPLVVRAASFANLALNAGFELAVEAV